MPKKMDTTEDDLGKALAGQLRDLGVRGILVQMAEQGQLLELRCEMPTCYCPKGRAHFDARGVVLSDWMPTEDHYPVLKSNGGQRVPWNIRLGHRRCNNADFAWRSRINALLKKNRSLVQIAEELSRKKVPRPHGTSTWTAKNVRKAFVS